MCAIGCYYLSSKRPAASNFQRVVIVAAGWSWGSIKQLCRLPWRSSLPRSEAQAHSLLETFVVCITGIFTGIVLPSTVQCGLLSPLGHTRTENVLCDQAVQMQALADAKVTIVT